MRALPLLSLLLLVSACDDDEEDTTFTDTGGTLEIDGCGYSITTRIGAEPPKVSGKIIGMDPTPRLVHLGIVGDPKTSIVAQWRTMDDTTTAGSIRWAQGANLPAAQLTNETKGVRFRYEGTGSAMYMVHQAHLCSLEAGTTYSYQVGTGDSWSPVYTFHTAPDVTAHPDAETVFGYVGDSRGGYDVWAQLATQIQQRMPDLVLFSGDATTIGLAQPEWEEFQAAAEPLFASTPVVLTNGNHEANAINFYSQFAMPGDQENFGFTYGFSRIFVGNDSPDNPSDITGVIPQAMDADFAAHTDARWRMMMHHRCQWSSGTRHGSDPALQAAFGPIVDKHKLDLVLNGHEHMFEMTKPLFGGQVVTSNQQGTVYVVAGGAGAELYGFGTPAVWSQYVESVHTAAVIRARKDTLTMETFRADGTAVPSGAYSKTHL
ncbi:MAG TPA: metallophosphoesterase family protein [Kofleriaceae bacterium]|nr:metallophosphoesterase family protein [Kofleriaceae bacterium]